MTYLALMFVFGVCVLQQLPELPNAYWTLLLIPCLSSAFLFQKTSRSYSLLIRNGFLLAAAFAAGFFWASTYAHHRLYNYHDLGHMGVDRKTMNEHIFNALKPGGTYIIADHAGRPDTGISESKTLHRIEEKFLIEEVISAGFRFEASDDFLYNPLDPRDQNTPADGQLKDGFILKFIKP